MPDHMLDPDDNARPHRGRVAKVVQHGEPGAPPHARSADAERPTHGDEKARRGTGNPAVGARPRTNAIRSLPNPSYSQDQEFGMPTKTTDRAKRPTKKKAAKRTAA